MIVATALPVGKALSCRSTRQDRANNSRAIGPARCNSAEAEDKSTAVPMPAQAVCHCAARAPAGADACRISHRSGRTLIVSHRTVDTTRLNPGNVSPRAAAMPSSSRVLPGRAVISITSERYSLSSTPASGAGG